MGPYYVTALMNLLGPVKRLSGFANVAIGRRTITSKPKFGKEMIVETPDNIVGSMEFEQGGIGTLFTTFATVLPAIFAGDNPITIFGDQGTLLVSNLNHFDAVIKLCRKDDPDFVELPPVFSHPYVARCRARRHGPRYSRPPAHPARAVNRLWPS